jgi:hypothetical protein
MGAASGIGRASWSLGIGLMNAAGLLLAKGPLPGAAGRGL